MIVGRAILILLLGLIWTSYGHAQKYNIKKYSVNEGLPSGNVYNVHSDADGYLWFATASGIIKYDGKVFETFDTAHGLKDAMVNDFYFEDDGEIWVATEFGGVASFKDGKFEYLPELAALDTLIINYIASIRKDEIWFATDGNGVAIWDQISGDISFITEEDGLPYNQVWDFHFENDSEIWITTMYGIAVYDRESGITQTLTKEDGFSGELMYEIALDQLGRKWVATDNGVTIIQPDGTIDTITEINGESLNYVFSINVDDNDGTVWVGTERIGLILIEPDGKTTHIKRKNGLSSNFIYRIIKDKKGNMWVTTDGNGVNLFKDKNFIGYDIQSELNANTIVSLKQAKNGAIWIGTENGLSKFENDSFTNYTIPKSLFDDDEIWDIEELPNGDLLLLTYTFELFQFNGSRFFKPEFYDEFSEVYLNDIFVDDDGSIWFSAFQQLSHLKNGGITHYAAPKDKYWQMTLGLIFRDSRGILWITTDGGLARFREGEFNYYTVEHGIPGTSIYEIEEDNFNNIWIGTNSGIGILKAENIESENIQFNSFIPNELFTKETVFLLFDDNNALWQGTNSGINYFDLKNWDYSSTPSQIHFSLSNNTDAVEFNSAANIVDDSGIIWFGTYSDGLYTFEYSKNEDDKLLENPPAIFLRQILADNEHIYTQNIGKFAPVDLEIDYSLNDVMFLFNAIDYLNPLNIDIKYKLEGYDNAWNTASDITEIRYTNLPAGNYQLLMQAKSIKSEWSDQKSLASFTVLRPFYLTVPFFVSLIFTFGFIIYVYINLRFSKIEKKELQRLVDQQTNDLSIALKEKEVLIKEIHHRVKNNLAVVSGLLELQSFKMPAGEAKMAIHESKMRVIAMSKIHENLYQNHDLAHVDFKKFLNELIKSIQATMDIADKNIEVVQYVDAVLLDVNVGVPLGLITNELISNCYKHAFKGKNEGVITVEFKEYDDTYELLVKDDGLGARKDILEYGRKSLGITLIKSLVSQIGGYIEFTNSSGSIFKLTLPKGLNK